MDQIVAQLKEKYHPFIQFINRISETEIELQLAKGVALDDFMQQLQDQLLTLIDEFTLLNITIIDHNRQVLKSFATMQ